MAKEKTFIEPKNGPSDYFHWLRWREVKNGILRVDRDIDEDLIQMILPEIDQVRRDGHKVVKVHINSCDGSVSDALAIYDGLCGLIESGARVETIGDGLVASAASQVVLQAGSVRFSWPSARFLIHEIRRWVYFAEEKASDLKDDAAEYEKVNKQILEIMAKRCGHTIDEIGKFIERRDVYFNAQEAKAWGLIDRIVR